jgi:hypothetical protein
MRARAQRRIVDERQEIVCKPVGDGLIMNPRVAFKLFFIGFLGPRLCLADLGAQTDVAATMSALSFTLFQAKRPGGDPVAI